MKKLILPLLMLAASMPAFSQIVRSTTFTEQQGRKTEWFVRLGLSCNNFTGPGMSVAKDDIKEDREDFDKIGYGARSNYDIMFGFNKYFGKTDLYWGMELGLGTRGGAYNQEYSWDVEDGWTDEIIGTGNEKYKYHVNTYGVKYVPFTLGYKFPVTKDFKIDAHLGLFVEFDFAGSFTEESEKTYSLPEYENENESSKNSYSFGEDGGVDMIRIDGGMQLGLGVWYKRFNLNFTWQRGFAPFVKYGYDNDGEEVWFQSSNAILSLGVAF